MPKHPYIAFYIGDWLKDPAVKKCNPATRGIWIDFICDMHESKSGGKLVGDKAYLCRAGRCSLAELDHALFELSDTDAALVTERNGVFTIICRRMRRESEISEKRSQAGLQSFNKRSTISDTDIEDEIESVSWMKDPNFRKVWGQWNEHREAIKKPNTPLAKLKQIQMLAKIGKDRAVDAINHSIANGYQGIFEKTHAAGNRQQANPYAI